MVRGFPFTGEFSGSRFPGRNVFAGNIVVAFVFVYIVFS